MTKQDEKLRLRRRLQDQAISLAVTNHWAEAADVNRQIIGLGEDSEAYNRLGKAYMELGRLQDAREAFQTSLRLMPSNSIARRNVDRLEVLLGREAGSLPSRAGRELVDLRLFITEIGKTAISSVVDVRRGPAVDVLTTGERVDLRVDGRNVYVYDTDGNLLGRLEPKLAQRLSELITGGNQYIAAVVQANSHQVRILIREHFQHPSQRNRISFPGKFGEGMLRGFIPTGAYDEFGEDMLEEEESIGESEEIEEEVFGGDEEELGLDDIEQDISEDEDMNEE
ncbi:MAG: tetratricopeptide repeat protein [Roseiflexaceae bacterium]